MVFFCCFAFFLPGGLGAADPLPEKSLAINGKIAEDGASVEISWAKSSGSKSGRVSIQRRILGQTGKASWQDLTSVKGFARIYLDEDIRPGVAYEYRLSRPSKKRIETGYWTTGREIPTQENRGVALVVVDETLADELAPRLERFMLDLTGDGWSVIRHDVPRGGNKKKAVDNLIAARNIRAWIQNRYNSDPLTPHALILIGHIPVVKSGNSYPDGHKPRPLETDLFYAEMDGIWHSDDKGNLLHNVIPSDHIEMQVGRIDFSNMNKELGGEISLLKWYFDKNHNWRHDRLGDLRQAYGGKKNLFVEINALRNIVGPKQLTKGGHHDAGTQHPWLFGVDFGSHKYEKYITSTPIKAVFSLNFGSGKVDFSKKKGRMTVMLAQQWYCLATGWGARPAWQLHHMALGKSIGYSHVRTVNNGTYSNAGIESLEYTPTGNYPWVNPIWVNLLGDPTLRPFPVEPVKNLRAELIEGSVQLSWDEGDTAAGVQYRIYRASDRFGPYQALNPSELHAGHQYADPNPVPGAWYMVRAHSLQSVYAGSFYKFSQGTFATVDNVPPKATDQSLSTPQGQAVTINLTGTDSDSGKAPIAAFIKGPAQGLLVQSKGGWTFTPDVGFTGRVNIPFTVFDGVTSDDGLISIDVTE